MPFGCLLFAKYLPSDVANCFFVSIRYDLTTPRHAVFQGKATEHLRQLVHIVALDGDATSFVMVKPFVLIYVCVFRSWTCTAEANYCCLRAGFRLIQRLP